MTWQVLDELARRQKVGNSVVGKQHVFPKHAAYIPIFLSFKGIIRDGRTDRRTDYFRCGIFFVVLFRIIQPSSKIVWVCRLDGLWLLRADTFRRSPLSMPHPPIPKWSVSSKQHNELQTILRQLRFREKRLTTKTFMMIRSYSKRRRSRSRTLISWHLFLTLPKPL